MVVQPRDPMPLTNSQIDRYSRQIIVPKIGGVGQERLLASRLMIVGDVASVEPTLEYLVGAGVGTIFLRVPAGDTAAFAPVIAAMRGLNPDVTIQVVFGTPDRVDLVLALASNSDALENVRSFCAMRWNAPMVFARLDSARLGSQAKVAVLPSRPPCPVCADGDLLAPFEQRGENAGFVAMVAAVEALKTLVQYAPAPEPLIIEFNGYESKPCKLGVRSGPVPCACGASQ
jgi:adenylyltransferase/sulfurtransferase